MRVIVLIAVAVFLSAVVFVTAGMIKAWRERKTSYFDIVLQLPKPTPEQTRQFAEYVTKARNWYKIIPASPSMPFFFYLDPDAGRHWVRKTSALHIDLDSESEKDTDSIEKCELTFEDAMTPHQYQRDWETTKGYRERFGFWNFYSSKHLGFKGAEGKGNQWWTFF